jgi:hypothetical protein
MADFIPALSWDWPIMPGKFMQGRPEGGGSFRNVLLHGIPLHGIPLPVLWRMNQRPFTGVSCNRSQESRSMSLALSQPYNILSLS